MLALNWCHAVFYLMLLFDDFWLYWGYVSVILLFFWIYVDVILVLFWWLSDFEFVQLWLCKCCNTFWLLLTCNHVDAALGFYWCYVGAINVTVSIFHRCCIDVESILFSTYIDDLLVSYLLSVIVMFRFCNVLLVICWCLVAFALVLHWYYIDITLILFDSLWCMVNVEMALV
jgi:hypothetical protein